MLEKKKTIWGKKGFDAFQKGTIGNGGQNLYVSAKGVLQRIYNFDINGDGYPDLLFANSQSMGERPPVTLYKKPLMDEVPLELPSGGSYDGLFCDLNGDGYDDLIIACQSNGTHADTTAFIYYGSPSGLSEQYRIELPAPDSIGLAAGDFNGDGKPDLCFLSGGKLRIYYQEKFGFSAMRFDDVSLSAYAASAADLDGDGYCDLYLKLADGSAAILWGAADGINLERKTVFFESSDQQTVSITSTLERRGVYRDWRCAIVTVDGLQYLFCANKEAAYFYKADAERNVALSFTINCPNAKHAAAGDLDGDGRDDIVLACCDDFDKTEESFVFWNQNQHFFDEKTAFGSTSAITVGIYDFNNDGSRQLVLCQSSTKVLRSTESCLFSFDKNHVCSYLKKIPTGEAMRIAVGRCSDAAQLQLAVINHETGRVRGDENIYIYLGGKDGYLPERRIELPGWAAVDGLMFDAFDSGKPDVLIANCAENCPAKDPGSWLYLNSKTGLSPENRMVIPTIRSHGCIVGDFRHSGYLDIASGGIFNREIRIFRGGPWGYDLEHCDKIVFGPEPEKYQPHVGDIFGDPTMFTDEERKINSQYGDPRWLFSADLNGDGWLDLFVSQISGPECFILWGGPEGFSTDRMQILASDGISSANVADLNKDGYPDLILGCHQVQKKVRHFEAYIIIYWGGPEGFAEHRKTMLPTHCANAVTAGDYNGNGWLDVYATSYNNGRERDLLSNVYENNEGCFSINRKKKLFNHSGSGCISGDFNNDGYPDLAIACHKGYGNHNSESYIFWGGPNGLSDDRKTSLPTVGPHGMSAVDPGNIMDRGDREYYLSEPYAVPCGCRAAKLKWEAEYISTSWCEAQVRGAKNEKALQDTPWSQLLENGQDITCFDFASGVMQYRLALGAKCGCGTPRVQQITVEFEYI